LAGARLLHAGGALVPFTAVVAWVGSWTVNLRAIDLNTKKLLLAKLKVVGCSAGIVPICACQRSDTLNRLVIALVDPHQWRTLNHVNC
jgi:hypothetical protein